LGRTARPTLPRRSAQAIPLFGGYLTGLIVMH